MTHIKDGQPKYLSMWKVQRTVPDPRYIFHFTKPVKWSGDSAMEDRALLVLTDQKGSMWEEINVPMAVWHRHSNAPAQWDELHWALRERLLRSYAEKWNIVIVAEARSDKVRCSPLHWMKPEHLTNLTRPPRLISEYDDIYCPNCEQTMREDELELLNAAKTDGVCPFCEEVDHLLYLRGVPE